MVSEWFGRIVGTVPEAVTLLTPPAPVALPENKLVPIRNLFVPATTKFRVDDMLRPVLDVLPTRPGADVEPAGTVVIEPPNVAFCVPPKSVSAVVGVP